MNEFRVQFLEGQIELVLNKFMGALEKTADHEEAAFMFARVLSLMLEAHKSAIGAMLPADMAKDGFRQTMDSLLDKHELKTTPKILFA